MVLCAQDGFGAVDQLGGSVKFLECGMDKLENASFLLLKFSAENGFQAFFRKSAKI